MSGGATGKTILFADDEPSVRKVLGRRLELWGYQVVTASNGTEALRSAETRQPDLMLLDVMMPGLDGMEVCRRLKSSPETARIPVILVTAKDIQIAEPELRAIGAFAFLAKPYSATVLLRTIQRALGESSETG